MDMCYHSPLCAFSTFSPSPCKECIEGNRRSLDKNNLFITCGAPKHTCMHVHTQLKERKKISWKRTCLNRPAIYASKQAPPFIFASFTHIDFPSFFFFISFTLIIVVWEQRRKATSTLLLTGFFFHSFLLLIVTAIVSSRHLLLFFFFVALSRILPSHLLFSERISRFFFFFLFFFTPPSNGDGVTRTSKQDKLTWVEATHI